MDSKRQIAAKGLFYIFLGTLISAVGSVIPVVGSTIAAIGGVLSFYGIFLASKAHNNYKSALYATILGILVNIMLQFFNYGWIQSALRILHAILSLSVIYFICMASAELLCEVNIRFVLWANRVWVMNLFCAILTAICLMIVILVPLLATLLTGLAIAISVISAVIYVFFLYLSYHALQKDN